MKYLLRSTWLLASCLLAAGPAAAQDCPEGEECGEPPQSKPLACDDDDTCAAPLACDTEADVHLCYYADQSCESDDDCAPSFECVDGADFAGECDQCEPAEEGEDPVCTTVPCEPPPDNCFPTLIACESDDDCPEDWGCRELTLDFVAPHWSDDAVGTMGCVPGGTLQLAEGNYYLGGLELADGSIAEVTPLSSGGAAESGPVTTADPSDDAKSDDASMSGASSGCAVAAAHGAARSSGVWLALAGLALGLRRRTRHAR